MQPDDARFTPCHHFTKHALTIRIEASTPRRAGRGCGNPWWGDANREYVRLVRAAMNNTGRATAPTDIMVCIAPPYNFPFSLFSFFPPQKEQPTQSAR
jgi:hypothetical protein